MNFTPIQWPSLPASAAPNRVNSRLDITLGEPVTPNRAAGIQNTQVGSIPGVLTSEENLAIASIFESHQQQVYTPRGATRQTVSMPGKHIDLIA